LTGLAQPFGSVKQMQTLRLGKRAPGYAVGLCGACWTIQRTAMMFWARR